ncbi:trypsin-like peptidase domain-containing protein [Actinoplanes sp. NPDC023714]|uniref:nSTAND1 domain-containing NTPase n=1 Tax=Actinoplanes sp. NPDC023714 TaxID=3154322 RepID=UPI0033F3176F
MTDDSGPASVARIRDHEGRFAGSGFLVAPGYVLTCAHVVLAALGTGFTGTPPATGVEVAFAGGHVTAATVVAWTAPDRGDTALLRLARPPALPAARLHPAGTAFEEQVRISGYAVRRAGGGVDSIVGVVVDPGRDGLMQLRTADGDPPVESGFSGSPVWSARTGAVVAMVVSVIRGTRTVKAVPVAELLRHFPEQLGPPDPGEPSPYRGLRAFTEAHAAVFKGREALTARLATLLRDRALLILMGPSGSGKSSAIRAGVVPALRPDGTAVVTARLGPGETPESLLHRLTSPLLEPGPTTPEPAALTDRAATREGRAAARQGRAADLADTRAADLAERAAVLADRAGDGRILLVVDQLEEATLPQVRATLLLLGTLVRNARRHQDGTARVMAAVTLRAAILEQVMDAEIAAVLTDAATELIPPMSPDELRAAVTAGGVAFEDGLVDTILRDAGAEPGRLPLIAFTLEELWQRRRFHTLTVEAYREVGGVSGALANHARRVMDRMSEADHGRVRAVLTAMARPAEEGDGFRRRPLELAGLDAATRTVVETLAARRLVVITESAADNGAAANSGGPRAGRGREYAEPAHQALLESWPELTGWLTEDREFLAWHDQLRTDRQRWEAAGRDPGLLLRGAALATARDHAGRDQPGRDQAGRDQPDRNQAGRSAGRIGAADRDYIAISHRRDRRRINLLRGLLAVVSALALVAGTLAVVAGRSRDRIADDLRTAASRQLAAYSQRFRATDPAAALQFAQAAWHTGHTPEAYGALFTQFGALDGVDRLWQGLWDGAADRIRTSGDGDAAVVTGTMTPVALTGLTGDRVVPVALAGAGRADHVDIDPTGRYVVAAAADGEVTAWDLRGPAQPRTIAPAGEADRYGVNSIRFAPDGARVLVLRFGGLHEEADVRIWDLDSGKQVRTGFRPEYRGTLQVFPGGGADTLVEDHADATGRREVRLRDLGTGRILRRYPVRNPFVAEHGTLLASCDDDTTTLRIREIATGRTRRTVPSGSCVTTRELAGGAHVLQSPPPGGATEMIDVRTGRTHRGGLPPVPGNDSPAGEPARAAVSGPDGDLLVLSVNNGVLYRSRLHPAADTVPVPNDAGWLTTPDGRHGLLVGDDGRLEVVGAATGEPVARGRVDAQERPAAVITPDGRHLVVSRSGGVVVYGLPGLTERHRITLPRSPLTLPDRFGHRRITLAVTGPDRVAVLFEGILTWWDVATGTAAAPPLPLDPDETLTEADDGETRLGPARPGHPDQVVVAEQNGLLQIWSLTARTAVAASDPDTPRIVGHTAFDQAGDRLAVAVQDELRVWDIASGEWRPLPDQEQSLPLGFTPGPDGLLVTQTAGGAQLWNTGTGQRVGEMVAPSQHTTWTLTAGTLTAPDRDAPRTVPLDPQAWFDRLCALSARPYTAAEAVRVRGEGGDPEPPCG